MEIDKWSWGAIGFIWIVLAALTLVLLLTGPSAWSMALCAAAVISIGLSTVKKYLRERSAPENETAPTATPDAEDRRENRK